jgi:hypothetical protein
VRWSAAVGRDIGRFKRTRAARPGRTRAVLHNGMAKDPAVAVDFYDAHFAIGFTPDERADLIAFLPAF